MKEGAKSRAAIKAFFAPLQSIIFLCSIQTKRGPLGFVLCHSTVPDRISSSDITSLLWPVLKSQSDKYGMNKKGILFLTAKKSDTKSLKNTSAFAQFLAELLLQ